MGCAATSGGRHLHRVAAELPSHCFENAGTGLAIELLSTLSVAGMLLRLPVVVCHVWALVVRQTGRVCHILMHVGAWHEGEECMLAVPSTCLRTNSLIRQATLCHPWGKGRAQYSFNSKGLKALDSGMRWRDAACRLTAWNALLLAANVGHRQLASKTAIHARSVGCHLSRGTSSGMADS